MQTKSVAGQDFIRMSDKFILCHILEAMQPSPCFSFYVKDFSLVCKKFRDAAWIHRGKAGVYLFEIARKYVTENLTALKRSGFFERLKNVTVLHISNKRNFLTKILPHTPNVKALHLKGQFQKSAFKMIVKNCPKLREITFPCDVHGKKKLDGDSMKPLSALKIKEIHFEGCAYYQIVAASYIDLAFPHAKKVHVNGINAFTYGVGLNTAHVRFSGDRGPIHFYVKDYLASPWERILRKGDTVHFSKERCIWTMSEQLGLNCTATLAYRDRLDLERELKFRDLRVKEIGYQAGVPLMSHPMIEELHLSIDMHGLTFKLKDFFPNLKKLYTDTGNLGTLAEGVEEIDIYSTPQISLPMSLNSLTIHSIDYQYLKYLPETLVYMNLTVNVSSEHIQCSAGYLPCLKEFLLDIEEGEAYRILEFFQCPALESFSYNTVKTSAKVHLEIPDSFCGGDIYEITLDGAKPKLLPRVTVLRIENCSMYYLKDLSSVKRLYCAQGVDVDQVIGLCPNLEYLAVYWDHPDYCKLYKRYGPKLTCTMLDFGILKKIKGPNPYWNHAKKTKGKEDLFRIKKEKKENERNKKRKLK